MSWTDSLQRPCAKCGAPKCMVILDGNGYAYGILTVCESCVHELLSYDGNPFKALFKE